jgi:biotin-(acetyl-CoA carboxylase) ligase
VRSVGVSLCEAIGRELDGTDLLLNLLQALRSRLVQLARDDPQLAEAWRKRSILSGRHVEILDGSRQIIGEVVEIAEDGALVVQTLDGPTRCYAGTLTLTE